MGSLIQLLAAGVVTGMIYALIAAGYTILYTATAFVNFALGAQAMLGGYVVYVFFEGQPLWIRILLSVVISVLMSCLSWNVLYRHVAERHMLSAVIMSFGFSIVLAELVGILAGHQTLPARSPFGAGTHHWGPLSLSSHSLGVLVICTVLFAVLLFAFHSRRGASVRAMFQDNEMAEILGIRTNLVTTMLFAVSGIFAAVAGILTGPILSMSPTMGTRLALIAFVGAILGGLGKLSTALAGGILLGVLEALFAGYVSADYRTTLVFAVFVLVLVIRPVGIFGTVAKVKV